MTHFSQFVQTTHRKYKILKILNVLYMFQNLNYFYFYKRNYTDLK